MGDLAHEALGIDVAEIDAQTPFTDYGLDSMLAVQWVERLRPRRTVLTHMGPDLDWAWMRANLPEGIEAAHDGLVLESR